MIRLAVLCLLAGLAPAQAQEVSDCDWKTDIQLIPEPWEGNSRSFANGDVRLVKLDLVEPAVTPFELLVLSPPFGDEGLRQCKVITGTDDFGFAEISFDALEAGYDPAIGLMFTVPVVIYDAESDFANPSLLRFSLNQATGDIVTRLELGAE